MTTRQRLFRAVLTGVIVSFVWCVTSYASSDNPTRAELLQTVEHIQRIAKDAIKNLRLEQDAHKATQDALNKATDDVTTLKKQVEQQTDKLNSVQDKLDKAAKALWWYRLHWWGAWIIFGLGVAACILLAILRMAGKLSFL